MRAEILAPAGDEQTAYAALDAGADAIYLGLTLFSARESASNFTYEALGRVTRYAHLLGAKVYVALNTLVKDSELAAFFSCAREAWERGADALLVQDIFLGQALKGTYPQMVLHLSTQAGCCNVHGAELARRSGFSRVVLARETPLSDIAEIANIIETEVFVQGALCTCFSGQCYFSSFAGNNSGNRGRCKQPCRKQYSIDRAGFEAPAYALSTCDLCVGGQVKDFLRAGAVSLKIEGRMRRQEYVTAAVRYYRALLEGGDGREQFPALKRAYNRGDYTRGLAFGQSRFLSRNVQGHIGERVGEVSIRSGKYFCESDHPARRGDGFKMLRGGKEVGGASFSSSAKGGFFLNSERKLQAGDEVRLTTDSASLEASFPKKRRPVHVTVSILPGKRPRAACKNFVFEGEEPVSSARSAPLSSEDVKECFEKTDGLPLAPEIEVQTEGAFLPKSALNALRRAFYAGLCEALDARPSLPEREIKLPPVPKQKMLSAELGETCTREGLFVYKPSDYSRLPEGKQNAVLYLPPFFTAADEALIAPRFSDFEGVWCDGYYGIVLAEKYHLKLYAGTGFNITNSFAASAVAERAEGFALSKELSTPEQRALSENALVLVEGGVKLMDLCYCPFEKRCSSCDRRRQYTLTDEAGRKFPLVRYELNGCRFEVYNCATLHESAPSPLCDHTAKYPEGTPVTRGHANRSML